MKEKDIELWEESFHKEEEKQAKKLRKIAERTGRSHFKKSDQKQRKKQEKIPPSLDTTKRGRVLSLSIEGAKVSCEGKEFLCSLKGSLKKEKTLLKNIVSPGDFVHFCPQEKGTGRISYVEPRFSILARKELLRKKQQILAVNIDQVLIVLSVISPPLKPFLADRYIIAAKKGNMKPILVVNKIDLLEKALKEEKALYEEFVSAYRSVGFTLISVSSKTGEGMERLFEEMKGKASVFSGQSGVGKSSLIQSLTGKTLKIGTIVSKTKKGSHATTSAHLIPLVSSCKLLSSVSSLSEEKEFGFCIDTPGIQSFGMWELKTEEISQYFPEIFDLAPQCKYPNCLHLQEPGCAVKEAVEKGKISSLRFASFRSLMEESRTETLRR